MLVCYAQLCSILGLPLNCYTNINSAHKLLPICLNLRKHCKRWHHICHDIWMCDVIRVNEHCCGNMSLNGLAKTQLVRLGHQHNHVQYWTFIIVLMWKSLEPLKCYTNTNSAPKLPQMLHLRKHRKVCDCVLYFGNQ